MKRPKLEEEESLYKLSNTYQKINNINKKELNSLMYVE